MLSKIKKKYFPREKLFGVKVGCLWNVDVPQPGAGGFKIGSCTSLADTSVFLRSLRRLGMLVCRLKAIVYTACPRGEHDPSHRCRRVVSPYTHRGTVALTASAVGIPDTRQVMFMFSPLRAVMVGRYRSCRWPETQRRWKQRWGRDGVWRLGTAAGC